MISREFTYSLVSIQYTLKTDMYLKFKTFSVVVSREQLVLQWRSTPD